MAIQLYGYNDDLTRDDKAISITSLKPDDKVLAHVEHAGRHHFGMKVEESLIERGDRSKRSVSVIALDAGVLNASKCT